ISAGALSMKMFLAGQWVDKPKKIEVRNPFDNAVIDTVPRGDAGDIDRALAYAERGAKVMAKLTGYERWKILRKAADLMAARNDELGRTISSEEGKIIAEGRDDDGLGRRGEADPRRDRAARCRPHGREEAGFHASRPLRRRRGNRAVQFSAEPRLSQSRPGAGGRQHRRHQARLRHAALRAQAHGDSPRVG